MNKQDKIKEFISNYDFEYTDKELNELLIIFGKVVNIMYGKDNIGVLNKSDIDYLKEKELIDDTVCNSITQYINHGKNGLEIKEKEEIKLNKTLAQIAISIRKVDKKWQQANMCNKLLREEMNINNLSEREIAVLVNMIIDSNKDEIEKEELLINLSLNLHRKKR